MPARSPLPESHGSITKFMHLEDHFELLRRIQFDTPVKELQRLGFNSGIVTTCVKRYLLLHNGTAVKDRLIALIQEDGELSLRVKMAMYFLFMLRDSRCRSFVCNQLQSGSGLWTDASLQLRNANLPEFGGPSAPKAYTNLRTFLVQIGLIDANFRLLKFPDLSEWFSDAVEIAAQHIKDPLLKQRFLDSPIGVLAEYGSLGIINLEQRRILEYQIQFPSFETDTLLPNYEAEEGAVVFDSSSFRTWNRSTPIKRSNLSAKEIYQNPALLERAHEQHFLLEKMMAEICKSEGFSIHETPFIDMFARKDVSVIFEMKSCTQSSTRSQIRRGISQLFEYSYLYRQEIPNVYLCLVLERKPRAKTGWLIDYVESLSINLIWKKDTENSFGCSKVTRERLRAIFSAADAWGP